MDFAASGAIGLAEARGAVRILTARCSASVRAQRRFGAGAVARRHAAIGAPSAEFEITLCLNFARIRDRAPVLTPVEPRTGELRFPQRPSRDPGSPAPHRGPSAFGTAA